MITVMINDDDDDDNDGKIIENDQNCQNIYYLHALTVLLCETAYARQNQLYLGHEMDNIK